MFSTAAKIILRGPMRAVTYFASDPRLGGHGSRRFHGSPSTPRAMHSGARRLLEKRRASVAEGILHFDARSLSRDTSRDFSDPPKLLTRRQKARRGSRELSVKMRKLLIETRELLIKRRETSRSSRESFGDSRESSHDTKKSPRPSIEAPRRSRKFSRRARESSRSSPKGPRKSIHGSRDSIQSSCRLIESPRVSIQGIGCSIEASRAPKIDSGNPASHLFEISFAKLLRSTG
jgi:hypothetical protein